ncbi:hypothetical protein XELAEV_18047107mg [Xenopus laevis]|uniref:Uncharacterized protein n=1 Tax=Xenopus laevis TaxID=8355 RepID=A0A974BUF1_XENLA|nr:hypothetical protein XELAEV_18047107mg [Xenopus laevis]
MRLPEERVFFFYLLSPAVTRDAPLQLLACFLGPCVSWSLPLASCWEFVQWIGSSICSRLCSHRSSWHGHVILHPPEGLAVLGVLTDGLGGWMDRWHRHFPEDLAAVDEATLDLAVKLRL